MIRRVFLVLAVLVAVALAALAILLPRIAERPEVRERLVEAARDATGRELRYESIGIGLFPPRLEMVGPDLVGAGGDDPVRADRVGLRIAWLPLLARQVLIERIDVEGAELTVRRTDDGFALPFAPPEPEPEPERPRTEPREARERSEGFSLLVRHVRIRDAALRLDDRTLTPAADLLLGVQTLDLEIEDLAGAVRFDLVGDVAEAPIRARGTRSGGGALDVELEVEGLALATLQPWIGDDDFGGRLFVEAQATAERDDVERLQIDARLDEGVATMGDLVVRGAIPLTATLSGAFSELGGPLTLDLSAAEIALDETFQKAAGVPATLAGRLVQKDDARSLDDLVLTLHNLEATGRAVVGDTTEIQLDAEPFALDGWQGLLPALGDEAPAGQIALDGLRIGLGPLSVRGGVELQGLAMPLENGASADLSGRLVGQGNALQGEGLDLRIAGQPFTVDVAVEDLAGEPRARLRLDTDEADSQVLLAALAGREETLSGPLRLRSNLRGALTGEGTLLSRLRGKVRFDIRPGRLKGVSFLKSTFDGLGKGGRAALAAGKLSGNEDVERFYDDEFERLGGTLEIADGKARSDDLRLDYRHYRVDLKGSVGLEDRGLDLTGKLTIFEEIDEALARAEGASSERTRKRVIPLAAVKGTVDAPRVTVTSEAALGFAAAYVADDRRREKWERKLDEKLGEGSGREVLDLLDSILTGEPPAEAE